MSSGERPKRRLRYFGPWLTVGLLVLVAAGTLSIWLPYHHRQLLIGNIKAAGGNVSTTYTGPEWLHERIGDDDSGYFQSIEGVSLDGLDVDHRMLAEIAGLDKLKLLSLVDSDVSDSDLAYLDGSHFSILLLNSKSISDAGFKHLGRLSNLQYLILGNIGDEGLRELVDLPRLRALHLTDTRVSDAGIEALEHCRQLRELTLDGTRISDAGLRHIGKLAKLQCLSLGSTHITDAGLQAIGSLSDLTSLDLSSTQITDRGLKHLVHLSQLTELNLEDTKVTEQGVEELLDHLPGCQPVWYPPEPTKK